MKCRDARELLNAYIDNGLDPLKDRLLAEHVEHCGKCRREFEFLVSWNKRVRHIIPVKAPEGFMDGLRRRLEVERRHPLKRYIDMLYNFRNSLRFPVEAVALVVIGSVISLFSIITLVTVGVGLGIKIFKNKNVINIQ